MHMNELLHAIVAKLAHASEADAGALHAAVDAAAPAPAPAESETPTPDTKGK